MEMDEVVFEHFEGVDVLFGMITRRQVKWRWGEEVFAPMPLLPGLKDFAAIKHNGEA